MLRLMLSEEMNAGFQPPRLPKLDNRLRTVCEMAGSFTTFADIGADHGYLSAAILTENPQSRGIVSDISEKALSKARNCIKEQGLESRAVLAVADGLKALLNGPFQPQVVFILGMGGDTISGILERDAVLLKGARLIVSAHTETEKLRRALCSIGYQIADERYVVDRGRGYVLIAAERCLGEAPSYSDRELFLGPVLMRSGDAQWRTRMNRRACILNRELEAMKAGGRVETDPDMYQRKAQEREWICEVLNQ